MKTAYPFHQYPQPPKFERTRHWHQRPSPRPACRMGFLVALVWSLCILVASL